MFAGAIIKVKSVRYQASKVRFIFQTVPHKALKYCISFIFLGRINIRNTLYISKFSFFRIYIFIHSYCTINTYRVILQCRKHNYHADLAIF